jgi:hypothetical protein
MSHCHCSFCRKAHGAAFGTYVGAPAAGFRWLQGADQVASFESSPGFHRPFCSRCGSVVPEPRPSGAQVFMPAGNLQSDPGTRPAAHIFAPSAAPWTSLDDDLPRFDAYPPGYDSPELDDRPRPAAASAGAIAGSCLCGGVSYEFDPGGVMMVNCYCSRCRRARSAAHATNLWVRADRFRWLDGGDQIRDFRLPEGKGFGVAFCTSCGGHVPRQSPGAEHVNVPTGSLDDDPGVKPSLHIFVGSKAAWVDEVDDGAARFDGAPPG